MGGNSRAGSSPAAGSRRGLSRALHHGPSASRGFRASCMAVTLKERTPWAVGGSSMCGKKVRIRRVDVIRAEADGLYLSRQRHPKTHSLGRGGSLHSQGHHCVVRGELRGCLKSRRTSEHSHPGCVASGLPACWCEARQAGSPLAAQAGKPVFHRSGDFLDALLETV